MWTAEDRACLEAARRFYCGDRCSLYVTERGRLVIDGRTSYAFEPSSDETDALILALGQAMKLHLAGVGLGELRRDLIAAGMREKSANSVHDHLVDVSVDEWDRLRARVRWYADDNGSPIFATTSLSGGS